MRAVPGRGSVFGRALSYGATLHRARLNVCHDKQVSVKTEVFGVLTVAGHVSTLDTEINGTPLRADVSL